ncbi:hypothetical protein NP493_7888g00000, partial [Ridgeia piscesae]
LLAVWANQYRIDLNHLFSGKVNHLLVITENAVTMEVDVETRPVTSSVVTTESRLDDNTRKPASRKNRFAALAQTINSYEDDLSHHSFEPKEPPKKVWAPPKTTTETPNHTVGPAKPPRRSLAAAASPAKKHVVSEIKVTLGKSEDTDEVKLSIVPGKTTTCSPSLRATRVKGDEPTAKPVSASLPPGERRPTEIIKVLPPLSRCLRQQRTGRRR